MPLRTIIEYVHCPRCGGVAKLRQVKEHRRLQCPKCKLDRAVLPKLRRQDEDRASDAE